MRKLFSEYTKHGHRIREIKTDPGSEFGTVVDSQNSLSTLEEPDQGSLTPVEDRNTGFDQLLREHNCIHRLTVTGRGELNSHVESCIGALKRKAGAMLYHAHMSAAFWCEAVAHSLLIRNSLGISAYENGITPTELYHHRKPDIRSATTRIRSSLRTNAA